MRLGKLVGGAIAALGLAVAALAASAEDGLNNETRLTQALQKYNLTGQGVVVGIVDRGIDYRMADFRNPDGTTRIAAILDLTDNTGANAPGNTYGQGTIYTRAQINAALQSGQPLGAGVGFRDAVGHGSATAGICCGNGRTVAKYKGVAPNVTLVIVKIVAGADAHGNIPAEPAFNGSNLAPLGSRFVRDQALALGMPFIVLPNIGSTNGPADGTSDASLAIDAIAGNAKPGSIWVQGTSDDGSSPNHAEGNLTQGGTMDLTVQKGLAGTTLLVDIWYKDTDRITYSVTSPSGNFGPFSVPANNTGITPVTTADFVHGHNGSIFFHNNKRNAYFQLTGPVGTYTIHMTGTTIAGPGLWQAALNPSRIGAGFQDNKFLDHVVAGYTINDASTSDNAIVPNSYVYRQTYTDVNGVQRSRPSQGAIGDLWTGSGVGPTWDGRTGMTVSVPGQFNIGAYAPESFYGTSPGNEMIDSLGLYGIQDAVSGANPALVGVIALMLEKNPRLDAPTIKAILQRTARADAFTGAVPNPRWGYGKLDALAALDDLNNGGAGLIVTSVLPYARSVQTGQVASGFGVMLNAGAAATSCAPALPFGAPAGTFTYQTTNGANQLIGTPNTPANIPGGGAQNFLFTFTPSAAFNGVEIPLVFDCTNTAPASTTNGVNTFILSASATATQDILAIGATPSNDGIVNIPGANGSGVMSVASVNIGGASGTITVTADVGGKALPVNLFVCETNPGTGACLAGPAASVAYTAGLNQTHTFSVFVPATGVVPFDPANNRVFVRFKSGDGVTRGATNAALRTQ